VYQLKRGDKMTIKNRKDNDLTLLYRVWVFGLVLAFASLFGLFAVIAFGVATPSLLGLLVVGLVVGVSLFMLTTLDFWISLPFPEEKPKKKRINSVVK